MAKVGDVIVGINGKRFEELGVKVEGEVSFEKALEKLREAKRPVSVMFERRISTNDDDNLSTRKRPAATQDSVVGVNAQMQQNTTAKKAKTAEIIDLT